MGAIEHTNRVTAMKKLAAILMLATALVTPELAFAKDLTITANIVGYNGPGTYLAIYVTKPDGSYNSTLWVAGGRAEYYRHLRQWVRGISGTSDTIDGITGASIGGGQSLTIHASIADSLIDAGYEIHVDSAVENGGEFPSDVVVPLTQANSGVKVSGKGFVESLVVNM